MPNSVIPAPHSVIPAPHSDIPAPHSDIPAPPFVIPAPLSVIPAKAGTTILPPSQPLPIKAVPRRSSADSPYTSRTAPAQARSGAFRTAQKPSKIEQNRTKPNKIRTTKPEET